MVSLRKVYAALDAATSLASHSSRSGLVIQVNRLTELLLALFGAGHKSYHACAYLELLLAKPLEKKEPNIRKL